MPTGSLDTADRPLVLIWELTQACDLACEHCRAEADPTRHPDELSTAEGKALLDDAAAFGEGQLVVLSGGDPLVRDDVTDLVAYGTDRGLRMTITPSGTTSLTADAIGDLADAGLRRMAVSLDGASPERHDAFRGEAGSFAETIRAAEDAREAGVPLQINTTVCAQTVTDLPAIRDVVRELDAVMWSVFFLVPVGRGRVLDPISPERAEAVMEWLHAVSQEESFGLKTTEAPMYRRVVAQHGRDAAGNGGAAGGRTTADGERDSDDCDRTERDRDDRSRGSGGGPPAGVSRRTGIVAGDGFCFVSHTGEVYPSGFLPESAGNVRETPVTELYRESDLFRSLRDRDRYRGKCGACEFRALCGGSRSRAYATTGDPLASDPLCPYVPAGYDGPLPWDEGGTASSASD
ncbi:radical SAM protein, BA_1875 family [Halovivax ruber XH-70]|uniref:Radical SAM protein, BA_1875 family n=1 Tax=Halovivax ruber (strain DSM 18193 / JCM 13892 / XH-70) TaxID=797302 RepID=L0IHU0_HALRX|nr:TIGR04053 family radical SAM/SPASM domain-containing protein [Halovivax ruber]AGB17557.1 radical SAM protein, BA_1875 family [Halovivax ruber XH-70]